MGAETRIEWADQSTLRSPKGPFGVNPKTGRPGPAPNPPRNGDKEQARQRVNVEVRTVRRPHPNTIPCIDCGHVWRNGERRHEYDHCAGYGSNAHLTVDAVCTTCHAARDSQRKRQTHCLRGHEFTPENTRLKPNGTRQCRECMRAFDRKRTRPPGYWAAVNAKRRGV